MDDLNNLNTIEKIIWTDELSIGNDAIDIVHSELLEIYNDLASYLLLKEDNSKLAKILTKMTKYSMIHFKQEEKYMQQMSYPKLLLHQNSHRTYVHKIALYNFELMGEHPPDPTEIALFLKRWWINHITTLDIDYERYKKEIQSDLIY